MGTFTNAALVAAVSNAGALGSLGASNRPADQLGAEIRRIRAQTARPFAVNFLISSFDPDAFAVACAERVPVISFALGDPGDYVRQAHNAGALVMHQVHTVEQAHAAAAAGVDVLIAQGGEGGGFGQSVAALPLVPQVVDAVQPLPVVAAGGIADGRGLAAALVLGAAGVNVGTRFLASVEAPVADAWKRAIVEARSEDAVKVELWNTLVPVPGRGGYGTVPRALRTPFVARWAGQEAEVESNIEALRGELFAALPAGRLHEYVPFAGESAGLIHEILPAGEIVARLVAEAEAALARTALLART
jgi:nitronate monooxygenase/enoyl-[acyl-carrier protein] reductase II